MYFKQIELHGFKSFADRTQLGLGPGITAIVGPNGCGKSNILDAMRWALGEQSAKALRGSHMQDVIFNGSEGRQPTGMAEVSLRFDNADNRLPVDFAEVEVSRRVYRSGESEYLLNKAPCRLRDIQELFMDTGIGTNAYSLIGQGKIDLVLSSRPEDRRFLFEEAAGIIKYKTRKRVAMRKLDSAEQNLLRLNDIIAEVQRQMRSLKRQVNAAIRHREYTEALRELEIRNAWLNYNELSGQITDLKDRFATAQETFEVRSTETNTIEAQSEELNLRRIELERILMARRDGEHQIDSEMERIESQIALLRQEIEFAQQQQKQALQEGEEFKERAAGLESSQESAGGEVTELQREMIAAEEALEAKQESYNQAAQEVSQADESLDSLRTRALDVLQERNESRTELETLGVQMGHVDEQLQRIYGLQESSSERHDGLSAKLEKTQQSEREKQQALQALTEKRTNCETQRDETTARLETLKTTWQETRETKGRNEARLVSLRELRDSYEGFATGVRAVMLAKQEELPEVQGIIGPVGDLLSTEKRFEAALEAALGGNINNVVVEEADAAKSAIGFLKKHRAGRVTFLPLDTIRASTHDDTKALKGQPGVIGKAIDHVQCEARIMPAVEYLLYNTVIVKTIDDAIRIARSERRFPRLVTLEGEVVSSAGAVTGGRTKHESRGLLGRSAEIEELEAKVSEADGVINSVAKEVQTLADALAALARELKESQASETECRRETGALGIEITHLSADLEELNRTTQDITQQRDTFLEQRKAIEEHRLQAEEKVSSMESDDDALQAQIVAAQQAAAAARERLSTSSDELTELRLQRANLGQRIEEGERNRIREQRAREEAIQEADRRIELAEGLKKREHELDQEIANNVERTSALSETRDEAHAKVVEAQQEQEGVVTQSEEYATSLKRLRAETDSAQKEVHTLELSLSKREDQVEYFQERILTEYNLALASLSEEEVGTDEYDEEERGRLVDDYRKKLQRLGVVNLMAIEEYEALEQRNEFLVTQEEDLRKARETLLSVVARIDSTILEMFMETFRQVGENFKNYFRRLFNGGQARVYLLDEDDPLESGIEIEARPPGKKPQVLSLLSGGEQALTAIALLFSIFSAKPSPFCVLDEVDAPLDDANIARFLGIVDEFATDSQFIIITHSKQTMSRAGALYGVTQQEKGVSQLVSVRFEEVRDTESAA